MAIGYPEAENIVWQTREGVELTAFEIGLSEALDAVFTGGVSDLNGIVEQFNGMKFRNREGEPWTTDGFEAEMKQLDR
jgi:hypothetical protein